MALLASSDKSEVENREIGGQDARGRRNRESPHRPVIVDTTHIEPFSKEQCEEDNRVEFRRCGIEEATSKE